MKISMWPLIFKFTCWILCLLFLHCNAMHYKVTVVNSFGNCCAILFQCGLNGQKHCIQPDETYIKLFLSWLTDLLSSVTSKDQCRYSKVCDTKPNTTSVLLPQFHMKYYMECVCIINLIWALAACDHWHIITVRVRPPAVPHCVCKVNTNVKPSRSLCKTVS